MPASKLLSCEHCCTVQTNDNAQCCFCALPVARHPDKSAALQRAWSFLCTALLLYIPANFLPIMRTTQLGNTTDSTIVGGVLLLWEHHSYLIASIIFIASVLVPFAKFVALFSLCIAQSQWLVLSAETKSLLYRATEFVGRWSMVDVFVVAFLTSLVQMGELMTITPGPAALAFAGMVILTMLTANSLDPRLFWNSTHD